MKHLLIFSLLLPSFVIAEESTYENPVDGKTYQADWKEYQPTTHATPTPEHINMTGVRLLSEQKVFDDNFSAADLASLIKATQKNIASILGTPTETFDILVDATLSKDAKPAFQIASQGDVSEATLQKISDGLKTLPDIRSKSDNLKFQLQFHIKK